MRKFMATFKKLLLEETSCILCKNSKGTKIAEGFDYEYKTSSNKFFFVKCDRCGHIYLNPRPKMKCASIIYPNNYYTLEGRHTEKSSCIIASFKEKVILRRLSYIFKLKTNFRNILEVGCGDCSLLVLLRKKFQHATITGVDLKLNPKIKIKCNNLNINLIEQPIEKTDLANSKYDLIIMNQLIEHLWSPADILNKLYNCLTPKGIISVETINTSGYDRKLFRRGLWGGYYFPRHFNLFDFKSIRQLFKNNGFKIIKQYSLLAPVVWTFSFHAWLHKNKLANKFFTDKNPFCLVIFTLIDTVAYLANFTTSNQKIIAYK